MVLNFYSSIQCSHRQFLRHFDAFMCIQVKSNFAWCFSILGPLSTTVYVQLHAMLHLQCSVNGVCQANIVCTAHVVHLICTHVLTHAYAYTSIHNMQAHKVAYTYMFMYTYTYTYSLAYIHAYIYKSRHAHTHIHICTRTHTHAHIRTHTHTHAHAHAHAHAHTCTHMHMHMHTLLTYTTACCSFWRVTVIQGFRQLLRNGGLPI